MHRTATRRHSRVRPGLEALEDRWCPTSVHLSGSTLEIDGNSQANRVSIWQNDALNLIRVQYDSNGTTQTASYSSSQVSRIEIELEGGNDRLTYELGSNFTRAKEMEVDLGRGNDFASFNMGQVLMDTNGLPVLTAGRTQGGIIQARLEIDVEAGSDRDVVLVDIGTINSASVTVEVDMDGGNDELYAGLWGDLLGTASASYDLDGNDSNDIVRFAGRRDMLNHEYDVDIGVNATLTVEMDGGGGSDLVRANMINEVKGRLNLLIEGGSGNDRGTAADGNPMGASASVRLLAGSTGFLHARVKGNDGNDAMGFELINDSGGAAVILSALLDGGRGTDNLLFPTSAGVTVVSI